MDADIYIAGVMITPNPVEAGRQFIISVEINAKVLGDDTGALVDYNDDYITII